MGNHPERDPQLCSGEGASGTGNITTVSQAPLSGWQTKGTAAFATSNLPKKCKTLVPVRYRMWSLVGFLLMCPGPGIASYNTVLKKKKNTKQKPN